MTANEKRICRLTARALRLMVAQDDAEADGDDETVRCLDAALGRLAAEAKRMARDMSGHDMNEINRVAAALIPDVSDPDMAVARTRTAWLTAHDDAVRAEAALGEATAGWAKIGDGQTLARFIFSMQQYGHAMLMMADAETDVHMAAMSPRLAADLQRSLESLEVLEG